MVINRRVVKEALKRSWELDNISDVSPGSPADSMSSETSRLIFDIFGGEILKTTGKKGWHFYNRINGRRLDFTRSVFGSFPKKLRMDDLPSSPEETHKFFVAEDYLTFFMRFVTAFEEAVGLKRHHRGLIYLK